MCGGVMADVETPRTLVMHNLDSFLRCLNKEGISTQNAGGTIQQVGDPD